MSLQVVKSFKNFDLIKVSEDGYCVRKRKYSWLFGDSQTFMCLNYNGTAHTFDNLCDNVTIGDLARAEHVFNANAILVGAV